MKKIKVLFLLIFLIIFICLNFYSCSYFRSFWKDINKYRAQNLTINQYIQDYEYLIDKIKQVYPFNSIIKEIYGYDYFEILDKYREKFENISSIIDFYILIDQLMNLGQDGHLGVLNPMICMNEYNKFIRKKIFNDENLILTARYSFSLSNHYGLDAFNLEIPIVYINGEYYIAESFEYKGIYVSEGSRILSINNEQIDQYVKSLTKYKWLKYDYINKKFYNLNFYINPLISKEKVFLLELEDLKNNKIYVKFDVQDELKINNIIHNCEKENLVLYISKYKTLYIKIPSMNRNLIPIYKNKIKLISKANPIEKIIIDIRDNYGGSDYVWYSILSQILDQEIKVNYKIAFKDFEDTYKVLKIKKDSNNLLSLPFLSNEIFYVNSSDYIIIKPYIDSIRFKGPIYLIQNRNYYSSSGSFSNFCFLSKRIKVIGQINGCINGTGIDPLIFQLPNSKLLFRIEPILDITNAKNAFECMHNNVNIYFELTITQLIEMQKNFGGKFDEEFLSKYDSYINFIINLKD